MSNDHSAVHRLTAMRFAVDGWGTEPTWRKVWDVTCAADMALFFCGFAEPIRGLEAAKEFNAELFEGFPALQQTVTAITADHQHAVYRHRLVGSNLGPFLGRPATGRPVDITGMTWLTFRDGLISEQWYELNHDELKRQLGV
jgi:predicted ester cyclase